MRIKLDIRFPSYITSRCSTNMCMRQSNSRNSHNHIAHTRTLKLCLRISEACKVLTHNSPSYFELTLGALDLLPRDVGAGSNGLDPDLPDDDLRLLRGRGLPLPVAHAPRMRIAYKNGCVLRIAHSATNKWRGCIAIYQWR